MPTDTVPPLLVELKILERLGKLMIVLAPRAPHDAVPQEHMFCGTFLNNIFYQTSPDFESTLTIDGLEQIPSLVF